MVRRFPLPILVLLALLSSSCVSEPDPFNEAIALPRLETMGMVIEDDAPWWVGAGRPISTGVPIPFYPTDEQALADCSSGEPRCRPDRPCLGWVEYSFVVNEVGAPEKIHFENSCPLYVLDSPFRSALSTWRFTAWAHDLADRRRDAFSSTRMAFPLELEVESDPARHITSNLCVNPLRETSIRRDPEPSR